MTNAYNNVLYTGITNDLIRRCNEHRHKEVKGFTSKYNLDKLIYFEIFDDINQAIEREKQIKKFSRKKKADLIIQINKEWLDLYHFLLKSKG